MDWITNVLYSFYFFVIIIQQLSLRAERSNLLFTEDGIAS